MPEEPKTKPTLENTEQVHNALRKKIEEYRKETNLEQALLYSSIIKTNINLYRKMGVPVSLLMKRFVEERKEKLTPLAESCSAGSLEYRTEEGQCKLSMYGEDMEVCIHQSELLFLPETPKLYCRHCNYPKNLRINS